MNVIFRSSNFLVLPFWVMIIALPRWRWTERIMKSPLVSMAPALVYGTPVVLHLLVIWPVIARPALGGVAQLLGSPSGATIAWLHFLAFDLFVGGWIYLDSRERCFSTWIISPTLFLTLTLGPLGFLLYLAVRIFIQEIPQREASAGVKANFSVHAISNRFRTGMLSRFSRRLQRGFTIDRPLTILGWVMILSFLGTLVGVIFDPRIITGAPAWLKPAKFSIFVSVYCFTLVWLFSFLETRPRNRRRQPILNGNHRLGLLTWQALRGESLIHPDRTIITLAGALILVTAISVGAVIRGALVECSAQLRTRIEMSANGDPILLILCG